MNSIMILLKINMVTTQFTVTDSFMYRIKIEDEEMFDFSNYSTKSNYYDNSNLLLQQ